MSSDCGSMRVVKRGGDTEPVKFDKITERVRLLSGGLAVNPARVAQTVVGNVCDGITTQRLDELSAETAARMTLKHPDYSRLAGRIALSNLYKILGGGARPGDAAPPDGQCGPTPFTATMRAVERKHQMDSRVGELVARHGPALDAAMDYETDLRADSAFTFTAFRVLQRSYLLRDDATGAVLETPRDMYMRVALGIHADADADALPRVLETFRLMAGGFFIHATPTLFNAGLSRGQMSSCFLMPVKADSIEGIFKTLTDAAQVSKHAGGLGISVSNVRAKGAPTSVSGGRSNGIVPMLRVFNNTARYVDQGGGKRKGAFAMYLEPWHADVFEFLDLPLLEGSEEMRARDLFYALWVNDLFMRRVDADAEWTLFSPDVAAGLQDAWGPEFDALYERYEREGKGARTVRAGKLWQKILETQCMTGNPFMLYKDACNARSNQANLGTIRSSNLCTEIVQFSSPEETAVCNLASIALPRFVRARGGQWARDFDFAHLREVVAVVVRNLNRVINRTFYPTPEGARSNLRHRPMGIGVQGLADAFAMFGLDYDDPEAARLNAFVFEHIYFAALETSAQLAEEQGPYETYVGSPASRGLLQQDLSRERAAERAAGLGGAPATGARAVLNAVASWRPARAHNATPTNDPRDCLRRAGGGIVVVPGMVYWKGGPTELVPSGGGHDAEILASCDWAPVAKYPGWTAEIPGRCTHAHPVRKVGFSTTSTFDVPREWGVVMVDMCDRCRPEGCAPSDAVAFVKASRPVLPCATFTAKKRTGALTLDWAWLRKRIAHVGLRNSLLVAPMPTASTSQILGNTECFEPFTSLLFTRNLLSGSFTEINKHLVHDLEGLGLWDEAMAKQLVAGNGSIQHVREVPPHIRRRYRTAFELKMRPSIDLAAGRSPFVDQSMSMSAFMASPTFAQLGGMHMYAWGKGLKTGMYYLRTRAAAIATPVTVGPGEAPGARADGADGGGAAGDACSRDDPGCLSCGS